MFAQSLRAARLPLARMARQSAVQRTYITVTAARKADMVQDMYLKELKAYKAPPVKASDAEGSVQKFSVPKPPPSPEEADLANDLQAYESQVPEVEGSSAEGESAAVEQDWFEEPEEDEDEAHH